MALGTSDISEIQAEPTGTSRRKGVFLLILVVAAAALWKILLLQLDLFPFNADEAIVGLMAKHSLRGQIPLFFYGQAYMGSLDALLVAGMMKLVGETVAAIRIVQVILYAAVVLVMYRLALRLTRSRTAGLITAAVLAIPSVNMTLYSTVSLGGYNEALLLSAMFLLLLHGIEAKGITGMRVFGLGLLAGVGLWIFGLTLVTTIPGLIAAITILRRRQQPARLYGVLMLALIIGALPWLLGAISLGPDALTQELLGSAIAGASAGGLLASWLEHVRNLLLFGPTVILGLRPPWSTQPLLPLLAPIPLLFWLLVAVVSYRRKFFSSSLTAKVLWASAGITSLGFILTPFGADPSGRYFLPLLLPMAVLAGGAAAALIEDGRGRLAMIALAALLLFQAATTFAAAYRFGEGLTTQFDPVARIDFSTLDKLADFLRSEDVKQGYTNYWVAYPLAFRSDEELIFVPQLPYHQDFRYSSRDDRYPPYRDRVAQSQAVGYITTNHQPLNQRIMLGLEALDVSYRIEEIGPFTVFYDLSESIRPAQLNLTDSTEEGM